MIGEAMATDRPAESGGTMATLGLAGTDARWRRAARVRGVEVRVHPSWWLLLTAAGAVMGAVALTGMKRPPEQALLVGFCFGLMLVGSSLVHELGHVVAGAKLGLEPVAIRLYWMGAATVHRKRAARPRARAICAAAGPAANLVASAVAALGALSQPSADVALAVLSFAGLNLGYALINLIPTYPQDGGQLLHAALWHLLGDERRALRVVGTVGLALSGGVLLGGVLLATQIPLGGALLVLQSLFLALAGRRAMAGA